MGEDLSSLKLEEERLSSQLNEARENSHKLAGQLESSREEREHFVQAFSDLEGKLKVSQEEKSELSNEIVQMEDERRKAEEQYEVDQLEKERDAVQQRGPGVGLVFSLTVGQIFGVYR